MARIKFTKNELKKQKDSLSRFLRYLPTLMLKKQQLQMEIRRISLKIDEIETKIEDIQNELSQWIAVFGEQIDLTPLLTVEKIEIEAGNIAGIEIPVFRELIIREMDYDLFMMPLWVDAGLGVMREILVLQAEMNVLEEQKLLLAEELRITAQRVNLFEKVKIPETKENIRVIKIYLGDQQTAAVVTGKIAKNKIKKE
ncbi:MAG: V-type ATP synthase subunit D [Spirochaetales bacterium]|nr:V-type ATP synthase subunit D [Spirochaetales bacterium]